MMSNLNGNKLQKTSNRSKLMQIAGWVSLAILSVIGILWLIDLEGRIPAVRDTGADASSTIAPELTLVSPGEHQINEIEMITAGDWFTQEVAGQEWLVTVDPDATLEFAFYGSELWMNARQGPEASNLRAIVDDNLFDDQEPDELGTSINLYTLQARDQDYLIASNLAHGEHYVRIANNSDLELAISGVTVTAATPFPWTFYAAYLTMSIACAGSIRFALAELTSLLGWELMGANSSS